jgi:hypothetical protein
MIQMESTEASPCSVPTHHSTVEDMTWPLPQEGGLSFLLPTFHPSEESQCKAKWLQLLEAEVVLIYDPRYSGLTELKESLVKMSLQEFRKNVICSKPPRCITEID